MIALMVFPAILPFLERPAKEDPRRNFYIVQFIRYVPVTRRDKMAIERAKRMKFIR